MEYETTFKKMAETLIQVQGEDGFWRMNLDDHHAHDIRPEDKRYGILCLWLGPGASTMACWMRIRIIRRSESFF